MKTEGLVRCVEFLLEQVVGPDDDVLSAVSKAHKCLVCDLDRPQTKVHIVVGKSIPELEPCAQVRDDGLILYDPAHVGTGMTESAYFSLYSID